ncbi:lipoic acid synthetase [Solidesulfovibrio fructosivorans JJ]]|uniref:Lipoyl synthase n=1 Tax=Solidesulfovibrio fructosivorans JJ] TaxID=596151 RepID=E1K1E5_SOLFR|nr:lipoyl synthase [Solidesulfovibrio fructosivorans]EFL49560.1 lipoic acid synthetase [Solidesulfovibrio fructosivorans JJ]]
MSQGEQAEGQAGSAGRLPSWLRVRLPKDAAFGETAHTVAAGGLRTVCRGARCPNIFECFSRGTATFLILGGVCTRGCAFCNITAGRPDPVDPGEPARLAAAVAELKLTHAVVTSVTRDDLPDGGAAHFAATIAALRQACPDTTVEVLTPDFGGDPVALDIVLAARPDVFNHNVETVPRLYPTARAGADYARSLAVLARAAAAGASVVKSGLMVGLGETREELTAVFDDLARAGCRVVTVGQYLRPSRRNLPVARYVPPDEFDALAALGRDHGIAEMVCAPLVRSSYKAGNTAAVASLRCCPHP